MDWNSIFFLLFPYVAIILAIVVTLYRSFYRPFTISSLSSQLLERRKLYWGSISFHYGIVLILLGHLLALLVPRSLVLWGASPLRLVLLELTGIALAVWAFCGLLVLVWRRLSSSRVRAVTTPMDVVTLILLLVSIGSGLWIATNYRFGTFWFTGIFTPYLVSIVILQPQPTLVTPLPWVVRLHVFNFFLLTAVFPFTRLVHIFTYPLGYLVRPWQIVVRTRARQADIEQV